LGHSQIIHPQITKESAEAENRVQGKFESRVNGGKLGWRSALLAVAMAMAFVPRPATALAKQARLPYTTIAHPQFIPGSQAAFMSPDDLLIGVTDGKTTKAYPAAILAQHGVVQDQMADGPIAVTW
jgi:hypothetical protein